MYCQAPLWKQLSLHTLFFWISAPSALAQIIWLLWSSCCFENSHQPEASKSWLPNLFYYRLMLLISIQPNVTWLSVSLSKVLLKVFRLFCPTPACMHACRICIHVHMHAHTTSSHRVGRVNDCVKLSSSQSNPWVNGVLCARHSSLSF